MTFCQFYRGESFFREVSIGIVLIMGEVEHLSLWLRTIHIYFSVNCLFILLYILKHWAIGFFLYIKEINILCVM